MGGSYQALPRSHTLLSLQLLLSWTLAYSKLLTPHSQGVLSSRNALLEEKTQNSEVLMLELH